MKKMMMTKSTRISCYKQKEIQKDHASQYQSFKTFGNLQPIKLAQIDVQGIKKTIRTNIQGHLVIEVIDTGIGISQEGVKKLFKPFSQADKSIQTKYGGTGLGLWISNKLVSLMRGKISVVSELNKGTVFIIEIPVEAEVALTVTGQNEFDTQNAMVKMDSIHSNQEENSMTQKSSKRSKYPQNEQVQVVQKKRNVTRTSIESDELLDRNGSQQDDIRVLLYQNDEMMKNLFKKYLQKHKIYYHFSQDFHDLIKSYKMKQFKACFIDIDINVKSEELEKLVSINEKFRNEDPPYKCRIYCFHSRDIDRTKTRFLQRNHIHCVKKPIQGYDLSKYLRRIKNQDFNSQIEMKRKYHDQLQAQEDPDSKEPENPLIRKHTAQPYLDESLPTIGRDPLDMMRRMKSRSSTQDRIKSSRDRMSSHGKISHESSRRRHERALEQPDGMPAVYSKSKFQGGGRRNQDFNQINQELPLVGSEEEEIKEAPAPSKLNAQQFNQHQNYHEPDSDDYLDKLKYVKPVKNKHIERLKKQDLLYSSGMSDLDFSTSSLLKKAPVHVSKLGNSSSDVGSQNSGSNSSHLHTTINPTSISMNIGDAGDQQQQQRLGGSMMNLEGKQLVINNHNQNAYYSFRNINQYIVDQDQIIRTPQRTAFTGSNNYEAGGGDLFTQPPGHQTPKNNQSSRNSAATANFKRAQSSSQSSGNLVLAEVILIVDDNSMNIMILQKMFEMMPAAKNIEITTAADGKEAFEVYMRLTTTGKRVKLILMDCEMPIMDGYDSSRKIKEFESKYKGLDSPTTIVGLSGNSGDAFNIRCKLCGMTDSLTKPVAIEQLSKVLEKTFGSKINNFQR